MDQLVNTAINVKDKNLKFTPFNTQDQYPSTDISMVKTTSTHAISTKLVQMFPDREESVDTNLKQ